MKVLDIYDRELDAEDSEYSDCLLSRVGDVAEGLMATELFSRLEEHVFQIRLIPGVLVRDSKMIEIWRRTKETSTVASSIQCRLHSLKNHNSASR